MAVFGFPLMKKLVWDPADEVYDCGDSLLVRKGGEEEGVPLSNIITVGAGVYEPTPRHVDARPSWRKSLFPQPAIYMEPVPEGSGIGGLFIRNGGRPESLN